MKVLIYSFLGAACVVAASTGLLTIRLSWWNYLCLLGYVTAMGIWGIHTGQIIGIVMVCFLLIMIAMMAEKNKLLNVCLACVGYLIGIFWNNMILFAADTFFAIPAVKIEEEYWLAFSVFYLISLAGIIWLLRRFLYSRMSLSGFVWIPRAAQYSLLANLILFVVVFLLTISLGEKAGYSGAALKLNCAIFAACLLISSILILSCAKNIKRETEREAEKRQQELWENYVLGLEQMVDEMRAFKHDYKNILSTMSGFMRENQMEELRTFFQQQIQMSQGDENVRENAWKCLKNVEPVELKGFLYEKLLWAMAQKIQAHIESPEKINLRYEKMKDLITVLGIFLDNAIEAAQQTEDGKVWVTMKNTKRGVLFSIENNYTGKLELALMAEKGYSTKGKDRGFGLFWAEKILERNPDMWREQQVDAERIIQNLEIITH